MKILKLIHAVQPLNAGEIAGYEDAVAEKLITAGHAELYRPEVKTETPEPKPVPVSTPEPVFTTRPADEDKRPVTDAEILNNAATAKPDRQPKNR